MRGGAVVLLVLIACSAPPPGRADAATSDSGTADSGAPDAGVDAGPDAGSADAGRADAGLLDAGYDAGSGLPDAGDLDTLDRNRNRLIGTYLAWLRANPTVTQTNGLSGANLTDVCGLWSRLDPSSRAVYLTLTHRLQGSKLGTDSTSMLLHVTRLYRAVGGQGATASSPGGCGVREYNRIIVSVDAALHASLLQANLHRGAVQPDGRFDLSDLAAAPNDFWRDSHDTGGAHAPFDSSDETQAGGPRGQVQFFADAGSAAASSPFGRTDLTTLVDPYLMEMDQDYDCLHLSNPLCQYLDYADNCLPQAAKLGTDIYRDDFGDFGPGWAPAGCP